MDFYDKIIEIDQARGNLGILGKMDKVLKLAKKGYSREQVSAGLEYIARRITNDNCRNIALDAYERRLYAR